MKATVNEDCIGCGMCEGTCPDVFAINDDGVAEATVEEVPADAEDAAQRLPTTAFSRHRGRVTRNWRDLSSQCQAGSAKRPPLFVRKNTMILAS